jgi:hypothetical protein
MSDETTPKLVRVSNRPAQGADANTQTIGHHQTPLNLALYNGNLEVICLLPERRAKANTQDDMDPLHIAFRRGNLETTVAGSPPWRKRERTEKGSPDTTSSRVVERERRLHPFISRARGECKRSRRTE